MRHSDFVHNMFNDLPIEGPKIIKEMMLLDGTFHKTYKRCLLGNNPQNKKKKT